MKLNTALWIVGAAVANLAALPLASAAAPAEPKVAAQIRQQLAKRYPTIEVTAIEKAPIPGLYTVFAGQELLYATPAGDYIMVGTMIEMSSGTNMSQELVDQRNTIDFASLPLDKAIKIVKGSGERVIAVFSDPDCPHCQKLEKELGSVADTTVYVFLFPIASLHPQAEARSRAIWCSQQRDQAWTRWMLEKSAPEASSCEGDPVKDLQALGDKLNISSTPTIFFANGRRVSGSPNAAELVALLQKNDKRAKTAANNVPGGAKP